MLESIPESRNAIVGAGVPPASARAQDESSCATSGQIWLFENPDDVVLLSGVMTETNGLFASHCSCLPVTVAAMPVRTELNLR